MQVKNKNDLNQEKPEFDLGRFFGDVIDHRKLIISVTSLCTLLALVYILFSTPIYQADALVQVEQKKGNAILNSLSQVLPDTQPQSAPEIALLRSRMILGKTVDDLNLQASIKQDYFPIFGQGWSRLIGKKEGSLHVNRFYLAGENEGKSDITVIVKDANNYTVVIGKKSINGKVGQLLDLTDGSLNIDKIDALPGTKFKISYLPRLKAITDLQTNLVVADL
ncbi:Wzz/FepE/Etk N-terminal domain-containing protein, partial [Klebsiella pneumoniae]|nr:Wzz/FepE/Etk N-terminal domain-containing protein [Klebsiella pneumoniae]